MMPDEGNRDREELLIHHHDDGSSSTVRAIRHQGYHRPRGRILDSSFEPGGCQCDGLDDLFFCLFFYFLFVVPIAEQL